MRARRSTTKTRRVAVVLLLAIAATILPGALLSAAEAAPGEHVSVRFEGCRGSTAGLNADNTCPDPEYTTGNLGPGWNELDIVPHRLTTDLGSQASATTDYTLNVSADNCEFEAATGFLCANGASGRPGYDFLSAAVVNAAKSHASCSVGSSAQGFITPGIGGTDVTIYRTLTIHQSKGTTCVFDWFQRLALGSHLYPGSSLHSNLTQEDFSTGGVGARDVSIPVKEIQPQSINKTMVATQDENFLWNITKSSSPATLNFENTCAGTTGARSKGVTIQVNWTRTGPTGAGSIDVVTDVYATNPAHRVITVNVTDVIKSGGTALDTKNSGDVDVPANTSNFLVLHHEFSVPAGTTDLNDIATASYIDKLTGIPVPGTTTATATAIVQPSGVQNNANAVIKDVEDISGTGLTFSVDSVSLVGGTLTYDHDGNPGTAEVPYTLGTPTANQVTWVSPVQNSGGTVSFGKTVYVDQPRSTSGTLSDTASVLASPGGSVLATQSASTTITASALVSLTVRKTIPLVLGAGDPDVTFTFDICSGPCTLDGGGNVTNAIATRTITFTTGDGGGGNPKSSSAVTGLTAGIYWVHERTQSPFGPQADRSINLSANGDGTVPSCSGSTQFDNRFGPASARVRKVTVPAGEEAGWTFTLSGPGTPPGGESVLTTGTGFVTFATVLQEGAYTITETLKPDTPGWVQTGSSAECSFTVNYPADADRLFSCTFTNTQQARVTVTKTVSGAAPGAGNVFTFQIRTGASATENGTIIATDTNDAAGNVDFGNIDLAPGTYQLCEAGMLPGWTSTITSLPGAFVPNSDDPAHDNSITCVPITLSAGQVLNVAIDNVPPPGGDARTIGFWRNWNNCSKSNGHQDDALTPALGAGILVGDLFVDTCTEAVRIVSKQDVLTGQNRANDAAYGLAAQFLAAKLSINAGAGTCAAVTTALTDAQDLLANDINFTGTGTYLGPKSPLTALRAEANSLAATLDSFNNNTLCP